MAKVSGRPEATVLDDADVFHVVTDMDTTPVSKRITRSNAFAGFAPVAGLTANATYNAGEAAANHAAIQAVTKDNGPLCQLPLGTFWLSDDVIWDQTVCPVIRGAGRTGGDEAGSTIKLAPSVDGDAVIKSINWNANSGAPSSYKGGLIEQLAICGSWRKTNGSPSSGASDEQQASGHGIAGAFYRVTIRDCWIYDVAEHGIFIDTTGKNGTSFLGECIENKIQDNLIEGTGLAANRTKDSALGAGGVTDGWCKDNVIIRPNVKADKDPADGAGMGFHTLSGWLVSGNHIYASPDPISGLLSYQPASRIGHGIYCQGGTGGARISQNKVADWGHLGSAEAHPYDTNDSTQYVGIHVLLNLSNRPTIISDNEFNCREHNSTADHTCIRVTTSSEAGLRQVNITANAWESEHDTTQTLRGIELNRTGSGEILATIVGNSANNGDADYPFISGTNPWGAGSSMTGNSWQARTAAPSAANHGTYNAGDKFSNALAGTSGPDGGWVCTAAGTGAGGTFTPVGADAYDQTIYITGTEPTIASNTAAAITDLAMDYEADVRYLIEGTLFLTGTDADDDVLIGNWTHSGTAHSEALATWIAPNVADTGSVGQRNEGKLFSQWPSAFGVDTANGSAVRLSAIFEADAAGTLTPQWKTNAVSPVGAITLAHGSWVRITRIG
jgi:hypothetical protein